MMTVKELAEKHSFEVLALPNPVREIKGAYVGDLLSWVMGRSKADNVWITIMTNVNVLAVASLTDSSVVIFAENARPDETVIKTACEKGINLLLSTDTSFDTAVKISSDV